LFQKFVPSAPIFLFSVHSSIENAASIIGMLIATFTIDAVGAPLLFFISGILTLAASMVSVFLLKQP